MRTGRGSGEPRGASRPTVVLPAGLRELVGGAASVPLDGGPATVGEALAELARTHPAVHHRLVTEQGRLRPHLHLFVGREEIRRTGGLDTPLGEDTEIVVLPAVSGG